MSTPIPTDIESYPSLSFAQYSYRIALAVLFSGALGIQREIDSHPAGLRTHTLVALGSALFTLVSLFGFEDLQGTGIGYDASRIASIIVSGIGFLGAGAILKHQMDVQGLSTAGSLWISAALGMAAAVNLWFPALLVTVSTVLVLELYSRLERAYWKRKNEHVLRVENIGHQEISKILSLLSMNNVLILKVKGGTKYNVDFIIRLPKTFQKSPLLMVNIIKGVEGVSLSDVVLVDGKRKEKWNAKLGLFTVHPEDNGRASPSRNEEPE